MKIIICVFMYLLAGTASAALISSDNTTINTTGQSYSQSFAVTPSLFSDVVLSLDVFGDYGDDQLNEHFNFFIDGILLADLHSSAHAGFAAVSDSSCCSWHFTGDVSISNTQWSTFDSDGRLDISWTNGAGVNVIASSNYVNWSLNGVEASNVPAPASLALLCIGLTGLGLSRKKKTT
ncbi:hypothetical protein A9Q89_02415 [Gammaproteobacteria bacterium 53_120_T64]|nr:hypothetical protein A9Q89_02415 [Gammaproteobacteria bacterium 53_120_T64]